jgi:hypothetical protein
MDIEIFHKKNCNYQALTPTIQAEDITPEILTYTHDSSNSDQTTHYVTFNKDVVVDILIVEGEGAPYGTIQ